MIFYPILVDHLFCSFETALNLGFIKQIQEEVDLIDKELNSYDFMEEEDDNY